MPTGVYKRTEEYKRNMSKALKDKYCGKNSPHFGKKHSEEHNRKISEAQKGEKSHNFGKKHSEEHKNKISESLKKKFAEHPEIKRRVSNKLKGRKKTEIHKLNISKGRKGRGFVEYGEKSPNWKGGISCEPYCQIWIDEEYKQSIRDWYNNECQNPHCRKNCNPNHKLCLHHIFHDKKKCRPWDIIPLCRGCNIRAENKKYRKYYENLYQEIVKKEVV